MNRKSHQKLPHAGPKRENLRKKGQFWTPDWVADAMVSYFVKVNSHLKIFDPAVGAGVFFLAAKKLGKMKGKKVYLRGTELYADILKEAMDNGLSKKDVANVTIADFVLQSQKTKFPGIVANPPYIRHHRIPFETKQKLKLFGASLLGSPLDGRAGLHVYFLLRSLQLLEINGKLAFILPADVCEGIFSNKLWKWIVSKYRLEAVITFTPEATPFPRVDTNPIIFLIKNASPSKSFYWASCFEPETDSLRQWILSGFRKKKLKDLSIIKRQIAEGLATGLSRSPMEKPRKGIPLKYFAKIIRGIATGANEFFLFTDEDLERTGIPKKYVLPVISKTRDVEGCEITKNTFEILRARGTPVHLLSLNNGRKEDFPDTIKKYIEHGESIGLPKRSLIGSRNPWYKMETRSPAPPILFAYLGRRNTRFIRNKVGAMPLTGFLCVYPLENNLTDKLFDALQHPDTIKNLRYVGKSYGFGAIKVEPRNLDNLIISEKVLKSVGIKFKTRNKVTGGEEFELFDL